MADEMIADGRFGMDDQDDVEAVCCKLQAIRYNPIGFIIDY